MSLNVELVGPERLEEVWEVVRAAFDAREPLDPPADAVSDDREWFTAMLRAHGGLLATDGGRPVGALLLDPRAEGLVLRRFGVDPQAQGRGVATAMVAKAAEIGLGHAALIVHARQELPRTVGFWREHGFAEVDRVPPHVELRRPLPTEFGARDAESMRTLGARIGAVLRAGDLVVLTGELGAGKTTFTQGLGEGLGVREGITSPTFVIARVHPSLVEGPALVHVDAYRLGGIDELDDLDLDTSLDAAVTVVEWGAGLAETLADSRLEITIERALADDAPLTGAAQRRDGDYDEPLDPRRVILRRVVGE